MSPAVGVHPLSPARENPRMEIGPVYNSGFAWMTNVGGARFSSSLGWIHGRGAGHGLLLFHQLCADTAISALSGRVGPSAQRGQLYLRGVHDGSAGGAHVL